MKEKGKESYLQISLTRENAREIIEGLLKKFPRLRVYDYAGKNMRLDEKRFKEELDLFEDSADRFIAAVKWIQEWMVPRKRVNINFHSYDLKHVAEQHTGGLAIANGICIAAALYCGYRVTPCSENSPYVFFNMDSVAYAKAYNFLKTKKGSFLYEG